MVQMEVVQTLKIEPNWKRIGLSKPLGEHSGSGIGIIILDDVIPHESLYHLKNRVKRINVNKYNTIICSNLFDSPVVKEISKYAEHGLMLLHLLTHQPMVRKDYRFEGLAPSSHYIFLPTYEPDQIKAGLEWILKQDWNIRIVLNLIGPQERGFMSPTNEDPYVQAFQPALDAGLLVIAAGGNSMAHNNLLPKKFFVVGGFNDKGSSNSSRYETHPTASYGLNGDGHYRPDILAPYTYLPTPSINGQGFKYFGGTCGGASLVTGLCAYLMSTFPNLTPNDIRNVLVETGMPIKGFPAPILHAQNAIEALKTGYRNDHSPHLEPIVKVSDENQSILSKIPLERALVLTKLIKNEKLTREEIWNYTDDDSPMVKKVAIHGLGDPVDPHEKEKYWNKIHKESSEYGVREDWVYMLLHTATKEELHKWMYLYKYRSIDIRICMNLYLQKYYPDAPELEHSSDPAPQVMDELFSPLLDWYEGYENKK
jgi:serine protease AprX